MYCVFLKVHKEFLRNMTVLIELLAQPLSTYTSRDPITACAKTAGVVNNTIMRKNNLDIATI